MQDRTIQGVFLMPYKDPAKQREYQNQWLKQNRKKANKTRRVAHKANAERLIELKESTPCLDCGNKFPAVCMHYHHRDPATKLHSISRLVGGHYAWSKVVAEIDKCDLLCANCHAIRHMGH